MSIKNITPILAGLLISIGAGVLVAHAVDTSYVPLAPLPGTYDITTGETNLSDYLSGVIKLLIALGAVTAILFAIIGGTQYVAASINPSAKKDALERIWNALIGLAIMLTSYLILNSINPELVDLKFKLPAVEGQLETTAGTTSAYAAGYTSCTSDTHCNTSAGYKCDFLITDLGESTGTQTCVLATTDMSWGDDSDVRSAFHPFITVSRPNNCTYIGESGCTSLTGLSSTVINGLEDLRALCNCPIKITGGTEYWLHGNKSLEMGTNTTHHKPGGNVVDLSKSTSVTAYIIANGGTPTYDGCANGKTYRIGSATYVDETSSAASTGGHWHVCF